MKIEVSKTTKLPIVSREFELSPVFLRRFPEMTRVHSRDLPYRKKYQVSCRNPNYAFEVK
jgi:hypothetical protein